MCVLLWVVIVCPENGLLQRQLQLDSQHSVDVTARKAAVGTKQRMVMPLRGVDSGSSLQDGYMDPAADVGDIAEAILTIASEKLCCSALMDGPKSLGLMHLSTLNTVNPIKSSRHLVHWRLDDLIGSVIGARKPWGSYTQLITDTIPRLLFGCSFIPILKWNMSVPHTTETQEPFLQEACLYPGPLPSNPNCSVLVFNCLQYCLAVNAPLRQCLVWHILVSIWTITTAPCSEGKLFEHSST